MEKLFKIKERGSSVRTEIIAGVTTFFAMAYIIFVNPNLLSASGMGWGAVFTATCIAAALGTLLTGLLANTPFAQAPGMGLNAFFAFTVCGAMGYTYQQGLTIVLLSGLLFLIITISPLRSKMIAAIPTSLKSAIGAGIGMFIAFIGLLNSGTGLVKLDAASNITDLQFTINGALNFDAIIIIAGILIIGALMVWKVKGAIFIGIIATTAIYYAVGIPTGFVAAPVIDLKNAFANITLEGTFFAFDFKGLFGMGILPVITAVLSFAVVDCFDSIGTLVGTAGAAGMLDKDGNLPGGDRALIADAVATCAGAALGTSTVTTFVESSAGISEGGRTGLTAVTVAVLFVAALVLAPIAGLIPGAATSPALIIVGVLMLKNVGNIEWGNMEEAIPAFLTIAIMGFGYSISDGISFGFISYIFLKLVRGKVKEIPVLLYIISAVFIAMYILGNL